MRFSILKPLDRAVCLLTFLVSAVVQTHGADSARPNILWITCEDTSPWLGCCGEPYATTPNLDNLARKGVQFTSAFATAPVCSPSRFAIISGRYATSAGTQRLRSSFAVPDSIHAFPSVLRKAGYYCSNNSKTDYNTSHEPRLIREAWDESGPMAHWKNRKPGQPFFSVFNLMQTHQGKAFQGPPPAIPASERHDPAQAPLPPYYPDTPEARQTVARVHDCITAMDQKVGALLAELERDGLNEDTIVFFFADHGQGLPRGKRTLWDTGLRVPLIVHCPEKLRSVLPQKPGSKDDRLVSLMDLGPTLLNLLKLPVLPGLDGQPFLGRSALSRKYVYGARDRVDEANDISRSVRDDRFLYIRNFMPDLSWNAPEGFSDGLPLRRQIAELAAANKLNPAQLTYASSSKPPEALYDTSVDPWQLTNLATVVEYRPTLERFRKELRRWMLETRDLGFLPEWEAARMSDNGRVLAEVAASDERYPLVRILETAERIGDPSHAQDLQQRLRDPNPVVRYWALIGLRVAATGDQELFRECLSDESLPVRIEAANILVARWEDRESLDLLANVLRTGNSLARLHAARTLQLLKEKARPTLPTMKEALDSQDLSLSFALNAAIQALSREPKTF